MVAIGWHQMPIYGASQIAGLKNVLGQRLTILTSGSRVSLHELETVCGSQIRLLDEDRRMSWADLGLAVPDVFIQTGWAYDYLNFLGDETRRNGGSVISMVDNSWKGNLRQFFGALVFLFRYRHWFSGIIVPGKSGQLLCRCLGQKRSCELGLYSCRSEIFTAGPLITDRPLRLIFVGQLITRKGIGELVRAFKAFQLKNPAWTLDIYGEGPLRPSLEHIPGITLHNFSSEKVVAAAMRDSRALILPSHEEHWGVVVHEAACSGCALILSSVVGAALDLAGDRNAILFETKDSESLKVALLDFSTWEGRRLEQAGVQSLFLSKKFSREKFSESILHLVGENLS